MKREPSILVCGLLTEPLQFADNKVGKCRECGRAVQFRPHAPKWQHLCVDCFNLDAEAAIARGEDIKVVTNPRMLTDLATYFGRKRQ